MLYGVYEEPTTVAATDIGVLMCYPLGHEYMRSHFAFRRIASMLAKQGIHSMRFDYYGTGDSSGESREMSISRIFEDIRIAVEEFTEISRVTHVSLLGLRFGGLAAGLFPAGKMKIDSVILWDPVVEGAAYLAEMRALHSELSNHPFYVPRGFCDPLEENGKEELIGYRYPTDFLKELSTMSSLEVSACSADNVYIYGSEERPFYQSLRDHFQKHNKLRDYQVIRDAGDWSDLLQADQRLMPSGIPQAILSSALAKKEVRR